MTQARFSYRAVSASGQRICGEMAALDAVDLEIRLKTMGLELIHSKVRRTRRSFFTPGIPRCELINFCFHLEQLSRAGVPLLEGLADLRDSLDHPAFRTTVASLGESIESGEMLSEAMARHPETFKPVFISLIRAGESSGQIPDILASLTESLKWEDELAAQSKKLLLYPAFVAGIVLAVTIFLMIFMVPQLKVFVKNMGQALPLPTRLLFFISDSIVSYGPWLPAILLPAVFAFVFFYRRRPSWQQGLDAIKLRLPVVGPILKKIILARFAGLFAMLYAAGIPVLEAIHSTRPVVGNQQIERGLHLAGEHIAEGRSISQSFRETGLFPPLILRMLHVGESTGGLDSALRNVAYFYHRDIRESVSKAQTLIEPILTLVMGLLLGWIMLSVIGPIYDVISRIKL